MDEEPIDLDAHRGMHALRATETRRERLHTLEGQDKDRQRRDRDLGRHLNGKPPGDLFELAPRIELLLEILSGAPEATDPRVASLIISTLSDMKRLTALGKQSE